jgi:hypothetical protein
MRRTAVPRHGRRRPEPGRRDDQAPLIWPVAFLVTVLLAILSWIAVAALIDLAMTT